MTPLLPSPEHWIVRSVEPGGDTSPASAYEIILRLKAKEKSVRLIHFAASVRLLGL